MIFKKQFPQIIQVILFYSNTVKADYAEVVQKINDTLLDFVLGTMINKSDFENIFYELKKQFKDSKAVSI